MPPAFAARCGGFKATGTAPSACHRPAAASPDYLPQSRHRRQSRPNEVCRVARVQVCPQSPAASCQAGFDFHAARSSQAPVCSHDLKKPQVDFQRGLVTPPFWVIFDPETAKSNTPQTHTPQGLKALFASLKTCFLRLFLSHSFPQTRIFRGFRAPLLCQIGFSGGAS
jgi:hypothetical protein